MSELTRRSFLCTPVSIGAMIGYSPRVLGANETVNVAVIGIGGRGRAHVNTFAARKNCRIAAVCDVNQSAQERAVALVEKLQGHKPKAYGDMRRLFEDRQIDAVSMATPNHWHALGTIWACQSGKDVYVEKPACHNVWEGLRMIDAARRYGRMVQVGSQSRSTALKIKAIQLVREGMIGKVFLAKGICYKWRPSIGHTPDLRQPPPGIDWDSFRGPAPMAPYSENRFRYNWHWFWDTGNGDLGNQGVHEVDICRWGLGEIGMPKSVVSTGGKYLYQDDQETPNMQSSVFDYGDRQIVFEVRGLHTGAESDVVPSGGNIVGNVFYGSEGYLAVDPAGVRVFKGRGCPATASSPSGCDREKILDEKDPTPYGGYDTGAHFEIFLKAVRSRNRADLTADIDTGVQSAALCHLANISYRLGRKLHCGPDLSKLIGDAEADRMLTREYRAPYVVPAKV